MAAIIDVIAEARQFHLVFGKRLEQVPPAIGIPERQRGGTGELVVNAFRGPETYGKELNPPKLISVSAAGRNLAEAMQRSLYHELGHKIIDVAGPEALHQVQNLRRSGRTMPISVRARDAGPLEYFSESLAAYRFEDSFADKDPEGYHMVEEILRLAWRK